MIREKIVRLESGAVFPASTYAEAVDEGHCEAVSTRNSAPPTTTAGCYRLEPSVSETILDKVAAAHPGAVEQCLTRYGPLVWSLARRWSPTVGDAEDAVQEIFTDLWRAAPAV